MTSLSMRAAVALENVGRVVTHLQFGATEKNTLLCWTENGRLWVRDARDLKPIKEYAPAGVVNLLCAISPTGRQLAVVTRTGNLGLRDIAEEKEIELAAHGAGLPSFRRLSFSRGEEMVASAGEDMTVRLWDVRNRREPISLPTAPDEPICLAFNHSSSKLAVGLTNGTILLYDFLSP
jgi:WD40 repeat protein